MAAELFAPFVQQAAPMSAAHAAKVEHLADSRRAGRLAPNQMRRYHPWHKSAVGTGCSKF